MPCREVHRAAGRAQTAAHHVLGKNTYSLLHITWFDGAFTAALPVPPLLPSGVLCNRERVFIVLVAILAAPIGGAHCLLRADVLLSRGAHPRRHLSRYASLSVSIASL